MIRLTLLAWLGMSTLFASPARPLVVVSHPMIEDWVQLLAGSTVEVRCLLPRETDGHTFQPNPGDIRDLIGADIVIGFDPLLEPWLNQAKKSNQLNDKFLWLAKPWISDLGSELTCCPQDSGSKHTLLRTREPVDPHVWMDPDLVREMGKVLHDRLKAGAPTERAADLDARWQAFQEMTRQVDEAVRASLAAVPADRRRLVTHHGNLGRFATRYGLRVEGVLLRSASTEAADPSAREMTRLIALARERGVALVVTDKGQRAPSAETLAREAGLPAPLALRVDNLERRGPAASWAGMMRETGKALGEALSR